MGRGPIVNPFTVWGDVQKLSQRSTKVAATAGLGAIFENTPSIDHGPPERVRASLTTDRWRIKSSFSGTITVGGAPKLAIEWNKTGSSQSAPPRMFARGSRVEMAETLKKIDFDFTDFFAPLY
jgi:hypothetical protein